MAKNYEVLSYLIPNGGYVQTGETYEGIQFTDCEPITKAQYEAGFAEYDTYIIKQAEIKAANKIAAQAKLAALGLTVEDLQALGL